MKFLDRIFGKRSKATSSPEQAVLVHFIYGSKDFSRIFILEDRLEKIITEAGVGEYDGNEIAIDGSDGTLYMYGPDADALFEAVRSTLEETDFMRGAQVRLRYGSPWGNPRVKDFILDARSH